MIQMNSKGSADEYPVFGQTNCSQASGQEAKKVMQLSSQKGRFAVVIL
jgi:hypothetical protein